MAVSQRAISPDSPAKGTILLPPYPSDRATTNTSHLRAAGQSQFLLTLSLSVQLPPTLGGLSKSTLYISTESPLSTRRLSQLLSSLRSRFPDVKPALSMDRVFGMLCADLEVQEHILNYQLEVAIQ